MTESDGPLPESATLADPSQTYAILRREQLAALVSPRRHDIVDHLAAQGRMSVRELARCIGSKPSAVYHHVSMLVEVGLVIDAGFRIIRRKREQLYATPAPRMRLIHALQDPANADLFGDIVSALCRQTERDFRSGLQGGAPIAAGDARNLGFFRLVGSPDPVALKQINAHLAEIAELLWQSAGSDHPRVSFAWVMAPEGTGQD